MDHLDFRCSNTHSYSQYFNVINKLGMGPDELAEAFLLPKDGGVTLSSLIPSAAL